MDDFMKKVAVDQLQFESKVPSSKLSLAPFAKRTGVHVAGPLFGFHVSLGAGKTPLLVLMYLFHFRICRFNTAASTYFLDLGY